MSEQIDQDDQLILSRLRNADKTVLVELYKKQLPVVRNYVLKNNGSEDDAQDLLQDSLVILWQNSHKTGFELTAKVGTYLMAICRNLWLKQLNKNSRMTSEEQIQENQWATLPQEGKSMDLKIINQCMDALGDTCKTLLTHFYFDGMDMESIAQTMNFANADTAKAKKYQCFKKLESIVKSKYSIEDFLR